MKYTVVVVWDAEGKVYSALVPSLPGCYTWGKTRALAFRHALDAIDTYLAGLRKFKQKPPREIGRRVVVVGKVCRYARPRN